MDGRLLMQRPCPARRTLRACNLLDFCQAPERICIIGCCSLGRSSDSAPYGFEILLMLSIEVYYPTQFRELQYFAGKHPAPTLETYAQSLLDFVS